MLGIRVNIVRNLSEQAISYLTNYIIFTNKNHKPLTVNHFLFDTYLTNDRNRTKITSKRPC